MKLVRDVTQSRPAGETRARGALRRLNRAGVNVGAWFFRGALGIAAGVYLVAHSVAESEWLHPSSDARRRLHAVPVPPRPSFRMEPAGMHPAMRFDVVDEASWESFPASDPPGY